MRVFIWQRVDKCSSNYHSEGGIVVIAENETAARAAANAVDGCEISEDETPDFIADVDSSCVKVFIFPDAGCC